MLAQGAVILWHPTDFPPFLYRCYSQGIPGSESLRSERQNVRAEVAGPVTVDLGSHGYKVENTTKSVTEPGSDKPIYRKSVLFYKVVDCSRLREIDQELQTLLPGKILTFYNVNPIEITSFECFEN